VNGILILLLPRFLSRFEGFAAFQAIRFAARGNESAKWAHPLWRELVLLSLCSYQPFCQCRHKPKRTADTGQELIQRSHHGFNSHALLSLWDAVGFLLKHQRKKRWSNRSQRNRRMKIIARILCSRNPVRLDRSIPGDRNSGCKSSCVS